MAAPRATIRREVAQVGHLLQHAQAGEGPVPSPRRRDAPVAACAPEPASRRSATRQTTLKAAITASMLGHGHDAGRRPGQQPARHAAQRRAEARCRP